MESARGLAILIALVTPLLLTTPAQGAVRRFAVVIGNNLGTEQDPPLRYAEADAMKVHDVLLSLGDFLPSNVILLRNEDAETVRSTLIAVNDRIRTSQQTADDHSLLFVYYSGHADAKALHLVDTRLPLSD